MDQSMVRLQEVAGTNKKSKIALDLNVGASTVTNWAKRGVSKEGALAAAEKYNADANYILSGSSPNTTVSDLKAKIKTMQSSTIQSTTNPNDPEGTLRVPVDYRMDGYVPVISWVAAGSFSDVMPVTIDDVIDWIPRPQHLSKRAFGLIIQGRSMWPEFKPDEIIYVEPEIAPWDLKDGDLVVIHCNDDKQATFKQLIMGNGPEDMYLKPLNPDWPDQKIVPMGECMLVGIVDSKVTRYR
ncbi:merops peptidase family S24 [Psychrobacter arcticus 273-4]|uniref:Merops peptidase family S24 n=1 Tax=Psychrobacter arcticus (strain DSM 17307 / VKM B-2377 / 273-4) TaxID=259536 RepID=Q4FT16_PSYA2|nr:S24 family peptidase [Psychrobacter arcticus]AAZ18842.1 merops peptidase family S24 [Psychrobacter arcticus 273-4]